jgi:hypothetical protein
VRNKSKELVLEALGLALGELSLYELPDLDPECRHHREQIFIGPSYLGTEEVEHPQDLALAHERKRDRSPQAFAEHERRPREALVGSDVRHPDGLAVLPDAPREGLSGREGHLLDLLDEPRPHVGARVPDGAAAEHVRVGIDGPETPHLPSHAGAERFEGPRRRILERRGLGKHPRDLVLSGEVVR